MEDYLIYTLPFLVINWCWIFWNAFECKGSRKYGMQSTIGLLIIYFLSVFQYVNFIMTMFILLYTREKIKISREENKATGGNIGKVIKTLIRQYDEKR